MKHPFIRAALAAAVLSTLQSPAWADTSVEERLKAMESRMNALEAENQSLKGQLKTTEQKVEATSEQVEKVASKPASGMAAWAEKTRIGGYGELHYNTLKGKGGAADKDEIDLHRFVLFFGHTFNERTRFFSELEVEHSIAGEGKKGEIELEQAYVEFDLNENHRAKAGLFMLPVGIMNETHEPPAFYGVERNPVEKDIIPATWWAGGAALSGQLGDSFSYDFAIHEGLATTAAKSYKPRDGRQKTSEARAGNLATTARLKWTGLPGIELGGSIQHQSDITQGLDATAGSANLYELHGVLNKGPFTLKALYAQWNLDGNGPAAIGADKQNGGYIEPSYQLSEQWGVFARYNLWDNKAGDAVGSRKQQIDAGVNWKPHPDVVLKADYQRQDNDDGKNQNGVNLGVGYQF
ncbi:MAG: porin [Hydrogenophilales bacterium 17-61-9]|nr:MAG: porin [Hydrogenophilales bacterium 17-61-9]